MSNYWDSHYCPMTVEQKRACFGIEPNDSAEVQASKRLAYYMRNIEAAVKDINGLETSKIAQKGDREFLDHVYYSSWFGKRFVQHGHLFDAPKGQCRCDICHMVERMEKQSLHQRTRLGDGDGPYQPS